MPPTGTFETPPNVLFGRYLERNGNVADIPFRCRMTRNGQTLMKDQFRHAKIQRIRVEYSIAHKITGSRSWLTTSSATWMWSMQRQSPTALSDRCHNNRCR